jgi:3-phytase
MLITTLLFAVLVPAVATEPVANNPDDPAVWINRDRPAESLILATDKAAAPNGALYVFGLDGKIRERVGPIDRPNNVDVVGDIAVVTERMRNRLRVYRVSAAKPHLTEIGTVPVFDAPMGVALFKRFIRRGQPKVRARRLLPAPIQIGD